MSTKEEVTVNGTAISSEKVQTSDEEVHGKQQAPDGEGGSTDNNNVTTMVVDDEQNVRVLEKRLVRKIDLRFIPWVSLIYLLLSLDRNNIGNAKLGTLESDLHLDGNEYYTAVTIFFAGYVICHIPGSVLMKRFMPSRWISGAMVMWGICSICQAATHNASGLIACRFFLGAFEAGSGPPIPLLLSFWYQREELALRVALYFGASTVAGAFSGAIAYGVLKDLSGAHGIAGWRWLFITEAAPTIAIGLLSFLVLPDMPETSKKWLTPAERELAIKRTRSSGNTDSKPLDKHQFLAALLDYRNWLCVAIYTGLNVCLSSYAVYLPTIIRDLGFSSLDAQLLSIPPYVAACLFLLFLCWNSDRKLERGYHIVCSLFLGVIGYIFLLSSLNIGLRYTGAVLVACAIYPSIPLTLSWVSNNNLGHTKRAVGVAMTSMIAQCFSMLGSQDAPRYLPGHCVCLAFLCLSVVSAALLKFLLKRENRRRDKEYGECTAVDLSQGSDEIEKLCDKHPKFRYAL
ncbi:hypothetical protein VTP01DRAFT_3423 [Rhizomucor pusillus]|uniref:uncharacterized protein n=1 Tax=Rhizomucor pusillus TaxID=4840 RepID=UPI00374323DE